MDDIQQEILRKVRWFFWVIVMVDIAILLSAVATYIYFDRIESVLLTGDYDDYREMLWKNSGAKTELLGMYFNNAYYCVWTKGRTMEEVNRTDVHEQCHALITEIDYNHFCGNETYR